MVSPLHTTATGAACGRRARCRARWERARNCRLALGVLSAAVTLSAAAGAQAGAAGAWESAPPPWLSVVGRFGPWLLVALACVLAARALLTRRRYRAQEVLSAARLKELHDALRRAELATVGEILPVVVERSDPHPAADVRGALLGLLLGTALLADQLPWTRPEWLLASQAALAVVGFLVVRALPDLRRWLIPAARATAVCEDQAFQEFFRAKLHETRGRTGVLLFVSLLEHRVVVMADEGIAARLPAGVWEETVQSVLSRIARGRLADGLAEGIERIGALLAEHAPRGPESGNQVPDRIIVRRE